MANVTSISEARKPRSWNRLRWDWQKAILADPDLPDRSRLLACVLVSQFAHHESAECRPGLPALADALSVSVDTVKRGLSSLEAGGWIERSAGRGRGNKLSISFLFAGEEKGGSAAPFYPEKGCNPAPLSAAKKGADLRVKGCSSAFPPRPPYKAEPNLNQRNAGSSAAPKRSMHPIPVSGSGAENWSAWLKRSEPPPIDELAERAKHAGEAVWLLPICSPPRAGDRIEEGIVQRWIEERRKAR